MADWQVYIIETDDGLYYTGVSTDPERRFAEHESQKSRAAKFFRGRKPKSLVLIEPGHTRSSAHSREAEIKQLTRAQKMALIRKFSP